MDEHPFADQAQPKTVLTVISYSFCLRIVTGTSLKSREVLSLDKSRLWSKKRGSTLSSESPFLLKYSVDHSTTIRLA